MLALRYATLLIALVVSALSLSAQVVVTPRAVDAGRVLCTTAVAASAPSDTTEDTLATCTVPANAVGANGSLRIWTTWTVTNSANNKTLRVRYSGAAGSQYLVATLTTSASGQYLTLITNRGATNSQVSSNGTGAIGGSSAAVVTSAADTTADTTIVVTCQKALNTETCTLERYLVELIAVP